MIIKGRRIRRLESHLRFLKHGAHLVLGVRVAEVAWKDLLRLGFTREVCEGECVLPAPVFGPVSKYNAEGRYIIHRDQPMETAYRMAEWRWKEWRGRYDTEEKWDIVEVPYKRYPRTFVPPPSLELSIARTSTGDKVIVTPPLEYGVENQELLIHGVNLFLEIFGTCEVLTEHLEQILRAPIRRLNWKILPPGKRPWTQLRMELEEVFRHAPEGNRKVIEYRLEAVNSYHPEFLAVGQAGFRGYVVFGFPGKGVFVLESAEVGNATYVFGEDWEELSKMTKGEILVEGRHKDRIIHRKGWRNRLHKLLVG